MKSKKKKKTKTETTTLYNLWLYMGRQPFIVKLNKQTYQVLRCDSHDHFVLKDYKGMTVFIRRTADEPIWSLP